MTISGAAVYGTITAIADTSIIVTPPTSQTVILPVTGQDRRFISTPGANTVFSVEHIPADWVRQARVVYVGGYLMMPDHLITPGTPLEDYRYYLELVRNLRF